MDRQPTPFESDRHAWLREQADAVRKAGAALSGHGIDWTRLAEELEAMGGSDRRELKSRLTVLICHLLKWVAGGDMLRDCAGVWRRTIREQRRQIALILEESPSLRGMPAQVFAACYRQARLDAADELGRHPRDLPADAPFSVAQALDPAFPPGLIPDDWTA